MRDGQPTGQRWTARGFDSRWNWLNLTTAGAASQSGRLYVSHPGLAAADHALAAAAVMRPTGILTLALLLAGCVSSTPLPGPGDGTSVFVHPTTGAVMYCENPGGTAVFRCGMMANNAYADCKTSAEEQGYVRQRGTGAN